MKRFLRKRWLGLPIGIIASVLVCGVVVAAGAWYATTLNSTGNIIVEEEPVFDYSVSTSTLDFGSTTVPYTQVGVPMSVDTTITVSNTGNQDIGYFDIAMSGEPAEVTGAGYEGYNDSLPAGASGGIKFILYVTPTGAGTIDFSGITFTLTPHS